MDNAEKYDAAFATALNMDIDQVNDELSFESTPAWDSVGHMIVVSTIEESFGIELDPNDVLAFKSYKNGKKMLAQSYGVEF